MIPFLLVWVVVWLVALRLLLGIAMLARPTFNLVLVLNLSAVVGLVGVGTERGLLIHICVLPSFNFVCRQFFKISYASL